MLKDIYKNVFSVSEFCQDLKQYEHTKFLPSELSVYYYELKAHYILKVFSKDLQMKIEETSLPSNYNLVKDLTLFQVVP